MKLKVNLVCIILAAVTFTACNAKFLSYRGAVVTRKDQIVVLGGGNQQGVWKTSELALNYHYQKSPETLKISGSVKLQGGFQGGFSMIHQLFVQILFLDSNGIVIKDAPLFISERDSASDMTPMNFEKTFPISPEITGIAFTYSGILVDGGMDTTSVSIGSSPF